MFGDIGELRVQSQDPLSPAELTLIDHLPLIMKFNSCRAHSEAARPHKTPRCPGSEAGCGTLFCLPHSCQPAETFPVRNPPSSPLSLSRSLARYIYTVSGTSKPHALARLKSLYRHRTRAIGMALFLPSPTPPPTVKQLGVYAKPEPPIIRRRNQNANEY